MLSVQNYGMVNPGLSFKANEAKESKKSDESKPYRQMSGLKTGGLTYGIATAISLGLASISKKLMKSIENFLKKGIEELGEKEAKDFKEFVNTFKDSNKKLAIVIPIGFAIYMGCGALIDKISNKKRAKLEEDIAQKGQKDALKDNKRAEVTRSGGAYYKSNDGKKYGALLGMAVLPAWKYINRAINKSKAPIGLVMSAIEGAIGGYLLGAITDKHSNKAAKKIAEKSVK